MSILNENIDCNIVLSSRFLISNAKDRGANGMYTMGLQHEYLVLSAYLGQAEPFSEKTFHSVPELRKCLIKAAKEYFKWSDLKSIKCDIRGLHCRNNRRFWVDIKVDFGTPFETAEHKIMNYIHFEYTFDKFIWSSEI